MLSQRQLAQETLQAAKAYRRAVAELARLTREGADIEDAAQSVIGAGLQYRRFLERWAVDSEDRAVVVQAAWTTLFQMPTVLNCVHIAYNQSALTELNVRRSRQAIASSRSMSWRTVS